MFCYVFRTNKQPSVSTQTTENEHPNMSVSSNPRLPCLCFTTVCDWFKKTLTSSTPPIRFQTKPIATWSLEFSRACSRLDVFTLSPHWLVIFTFALIGRCDFFGLISVLRHSTETFYNTASKRDLYQQEKYLRQIEDLFIIFPNNLLYNKFSFSKYIIRIDRS